MAQYTPSPYIVSELRPSGPTGASGGAYQLDANSASPTRIIGRDEIGMPIEETIPAAMWREYVHPCGAYNKVPIRTAVGGDTSGPEYERYGQQVDRELVRAGWIPSDMCPYSFEYKHVLGGSFVRPPAGESDCGGSKADGGCSHLIAVSKARIARARAKHDADQAAVTSMRPEDAQRMMDSVAEGVGAAISKHLDARSMKAQSSARLRDGKGEQD